MDLRREREMESGGRAEAGTQISWRRAAVSWLRRVAAKSFATIIS